MYIQLIFFLPLAMTSFLIIVTHSLFNAALTRLPSPEIYIAAFAVAKSLMHLLHSPLFMVRQTITSLIEDKKSYYQVKTFLLKLMVLVVLILAVVAISGLSNWIFKNIMGLKGRTLTESINILKVLIIFPVAVTLRNFMQGISIKFNKNIFITFGTVARIIFVFLVVLYIDSFSFVPGYLIAGGIFLGAVSVEALVVFIGVKLSVGNIKKKTNDLDNENLREEKTDNKKKIPENYVFSFYWPLIITGFIKTLATPIINTGLARTLNPEMALSAYAVAFSFGIILYSPTFMFHQVSINFIDGNNHNITEVRHFGIYLGLFCSLLIGLVAFTNIGEYILMNWIGASKEITLLALDVLKIMIVLPFITVAREFYWGILMKRRKTQYVGKGKFVNIVSLVIGIIIMTALNPPNPAIVGIIGFIIGQLMESVYLFFIARRNLVIY